MDFTKEYSKQNLIRFLIPLLAADLFQQFYALINTVVVSQVLDYTAVAVIGSCSGFILIRSQLISGMIYGFGIYLGKAVGTKDTVFFRNAFSGSFWCVMGISALGFAVLPLIEMLLAIGNVPMELRADATAYLAVSFGGSFCIALKILLLVMLQAIGETRFFSALAAAGVVINTTLAILFIGFFHRGVAFSALATVLTNLLLAGCLYWHICKKHKNMLGLVLPNAVPGRIWADLIKNGTAKSVYFFLCSLGKFILQGTINTFPISVIAGQSWAVCLQTILLSPLGELGTASGVITGQNVGAGNLGNVRIYHRKLCRIMVSIGAAEILFIHLAGFPLLQLLCGKDKPIEVVGAANRWIHMTVLAMPFCFGILYRNALQAMGKYVQTLILGAAELIGICVTVWLFVPRNGYSAAAAGMAASWLLQAAIGCVCFRNSMKGGRKFGECKETVNSVPD